METLNGLTSLFQDIFRFSQVSFKSINFGDAIVSPIYGQDQNELLCKSNMNLWFPFFALRSTKPLRITGIKFVKLCGITVFNLLVHNFICKELK